MPLVVDASVAIKLVIDEDGSAAAHALAASPEDFIAPDLLVIEAANTLWKLSVRRTVTVEQSKAGLASLMTVFREFVPSLELAQDALSLAIQIKHSVYDCLYLALAQRRNCVLVTADKGLIASVKDTRYARFVKHLEKWK